MDYLYSISHIIEKMYGRNDSEFLSEKMVKKLVEQKPKIMQKVKENLAESAEFRNLPVTYPKFLLLPAEGL